MYDCTQALPGYSTRMERKATTQLWSDTYMREGSYDVLKVVRDGDFFGEAGCITCQPRSASVVATVPSELLKLERTNLISIFRQYPKYLEDLGITVCAFACMHACMRCLWPHASSVT